MKEKKIPMRRCIGCNTSKPKSELIRIAAYEGEITIDETGRSKGRGAYLCPSKECLEKAKKRRAVVRNLEVEISSETMQELLGKLEVNERKN